jgi:putative chitinase
MTIFAPSAAQWEKILVLCGVASRDASTWSPIFSEEIDDGTFSAGLATELPDFLGQILHESLMLKRLEENLYYTRPERLMQVWPKRFNTLVRASQYTRNPQKLADYVYGDRLGNINGDGWSYRGSGLIMCTGRANFELIEQITELPVVENPDMLRQPGTALMVAIAWWEARVPDSAMGDRVRVRRAVNGGQIGFQDTARLSDIAEEALYELVS